MHPELTGHFWTLRLGGWSRNLFRREVGSCLRKEGAWGGGSWSAVLRRARLIAGSPGRCLGTPWPPGWRVLLASGRWRSGVFHAPHAAIPKEPRGPSRPACYPHLHRALDVSAASPPHQWCSDLGLSIGLRDASG